MWRIKAQATSFCCLAGKKIVVLGLGKSGQIGEKIAATLTSTGTPAVTLDAFNGLHGDLGIRGAGRTAAQDLIDYLRKISGLDSKLDTLQKVEPAVA
jgi:phosphoglycerate dehydrogenase-like enzyme